MCVIMAAHNAAGTIAEAIESIQSQTFSDWRLLVVNDASSDETRSILSRVQASDPRIQTIELEENRGLAYCLNLAIEQSEEPLIARMDADDIALPERIILQVEYLKNNPNVDVLGTGAEVLSGGMADRRLLIYPEEHAELAKNIYIRNPFIHPSVMFRRSFIKQASGYSNDLRRAQDYDLWLRTYQNSRFHNLPKPLIKYRLSKSPSIRNAAYSSLVIWKALRREGTWLWKGWYALRPFLAYFYRRLDCRSE